MHVIHRMRQDSVSSRLHLALRLEVSRRGPSTYRRWGELCLSGFTISRSMLGASTSMRRWTPSDKEWRNVGATYLVALVTLCMFPMNCDCLIVVVSACLSCSGMWSQTFQDLTEEPAFKLIVGSLGAQGGYSQWTQGLRLRSWKNEESQRTSCKWLQPAVLWTWSHPVAMRYLGAWPWLRHLSFGVSAISDAQELPQEFSPNYWGIQNRFSTAMGWSSRTSILKKGGFWTWTPRAERMPCLEVAFSAAISDMAWQAAYLLRPLLFTCQAHQELLQQLGSDSWAQSEDVSELDKAWYNWQETKRYLIYLDILGFKGQGFL